MAIGYDGARPMRYLLAVLSHGEKSETAPVAIGSFLERVDPAPNVIVCAHDGPGSIYRPAIHEIDVRAIRLFPESQGFGRATGALWALAAAYAEEERLDHVFWLEHDFKIIRDVPLREAAWILLRRPEIAQVSLMRQPVNANERAAGSIVESRPEEFQAESQGPIRWLRHRSYFTTNPSLMRASFLRARPWPSYDDNSEGMFGLELAVAGYEYAVLGYGETWCEHLGTRNGKGY